MDDSIGKTMAFVEAMQALFRQHRQKTPSEGVYRRIALGRLNMLYSEQTVHAGAPYILGNVLQPIYEAGVPIDEVIAIEALIFGSSLFDTHHAQMQLLALKRSGVLDLMVKNRG